MFLTIVFSICGINLFIQMITVNMHLTRPPKAVPKWLKNLKSFLSCHFKCRDLITDEKPILPEVQDPSLTQKQEDKTSAAGPDAKLVDEIRVLSNKVKSDEEEDALSEEWKSIADFFNTFFFYLSMTAQMVTATVCFAILPALDYSPDWKMWSFVLVSFFVFVRYPVYKRKSSQSLTFDTLEITLS